MSKWSVQFSLESIDELEMAIEYYNIQKKDLGMDFSLEFEKQIELLVINPYVHAIRYLNVRLAMLERFPYAIHYTINEIPKKNYRTNYTFYFLLSETRKQTGEYGCNKGGNTVVKALKFNRICKSGGGEKPE